MLTKLLGGWLPLLVHSFYIGPKFSFWCSLCAHADRSPYLTMWPQTKNVLPRHPQSWTPLLRSKPFNMAMGWIKHEFIPLPWTWWPELIRATSFHSLPSAEMRQISCQQIFHLEHWQEGKNIQRADMRFASSLQMGESERKLPWLVQVIMSKGGE